ncbi:MAG: cystathionine gamma-synthase family protein [Gammaproteobacteria bacterium]|nr:cystathionine gamma-synthase family protein [Gammaproteobacteria bacterium]
MKSEGFTTKILHNDRQSKIEHGSLHKPIHTSVAFEYDDVHALADVFQGKACGYSYGRQNNPTTSALEDKVTLMEGGVDSVCFATGMSAIISTMISLLRAGDHLISSAFLFGNTNSLFNTLKTLGIEVTFVDATDVNNVVAAVQANTKAVFVETIANPCTQVSDLEGIGEFCESNNLLYIVDNTITSPYLFLPKSVKAGLIINSLTKYIGGHGNALGGAVTETGCYDWSQFKNIYDNYKKGPISNWGLLQIKKKGLRDMGGTISPESAHHLAIGAETLALRMERSCENAATLARFFESHQTVKKVFHPSIKSHPEHERAQKLFKHSGSLMSIELTNQVDCFDFLNSLEAVVASSNLGDNRTLGIPVAHTIFYEMGAERRASMGISDSMIRLSIGIEDQNDLLNDFDRALTK